MMTTQLTTNPSLTEYRARHEQVLYTLLSDAVIPAPLIRDAMHYCLFPGGKRLRPLLIYACGELFEIPLATLDILAVAIEMVHVYSLIHDDLPAMDNDDLRRGRPTCHRAFDEATAILVGDGLQALAIDILLQQLPMHLKPEQVIAITHTLLKACGPSGMVSGQSLDLSLLTQVKIDESHLQTIHQLKTGELIKACINMTLEACTPKPSDSAALRQFAHHLGLLFQMQDDYLDCYSQLDVLGKGRLSDVANQKQTFASLYKADALAELISQHILAARRSLEQCSEQAQRLHDILDIVHKRI
jgi:farnesyl diphosphate synthase